MPNVTSKSVTIPGTQPAGSQHTVDATFAPDTADTYTVVATAGDGGTISPTGSTDYPVGQDAIYQITANPGNHIDTIKVDGVAIDLSANPTAAAGGAAQNAAHLGR
jgi:hypothetical protein